VPPVACDLWVCSDARDVDERDFQGALKSPEFVGASNMQRQSAFRTDKSTNGKLLRLTYFNYDRHIEFRILLLHILRPVSLAELFDHR
jgi:hypothetical protein